MQEVHGATGVSAGLRALPGRALARSERRPVLAIFLLALLLRAAAAIGIAVFSGGNLFIDDESYFRMASAVAGGRYDELGDYYQWLYGRTGTMLVPVTALLWVFGPHHLAGQLWIALLGAATAAFT